MWKARLIITLLGLAILAYLGSAVAKGLYQIMNYSTSRITSVTNSSTETR